MTPCPGRLLGQSQSSYIEPTGGQKPSQGDNSIPSRQSVHSESGRPRERERIRVSGVHLPR